MLTLEKLESMSRCCIEQVSKENLVDICEVKIEDGLPDSQRMLRYLEQIQNPYCFLCGNTPVGLSFANEEQELSHLLVNYFCTLKGLAG